MLHAAQRRRVRPVLVPAVVVLCLLPVGLMSGATASAADPASAADTALLGGRSVVAEQLPAGPVLTAPWTGAAIFPRPMTADLLRRVAAPAASRSVARAAAPATPGLLPAGSFTAGPVTPPPVPDPTTMTTAQLAQLLLDDPAVVAGDPSVTADLQDAAAGRPGTAGTMLQREVLLFVAMAARTHTLGISALEDHGRQHAADSRHYRGAAVDISYLDGVHLSGRDTGSRALAQLAFDVLPAGSGIGQEGCGRAIPLPAGWQTFPDSCTHLHVQVPADD